MLLKGTGCHCVLVHVRHVYVIEKPSEQAGMTFLARQRSQVESSNTNAGRHYK